MTASLSELVLAQFNHMSLPTRNPPTANSADISYLRSHRVSDSRDPHTIELSRCSSSGSPMPGITRFLVRRCYAPSCTPSPPIPHFWGQVPFPLPRGRPLEHTQAHRLTVYFSLTACLCLLPSAFFIPAAPFTARKVPAACLFPDKPCSHIHMLPFGLQSAFCLFSSLKPRPWTIKPSLSSLNHD